MKNFRLKNKLFIIASSFTAVLGMHGSPLAQEWNPFKELFGETQQKSNSGQTSRNQASDELPPRAQVVLASRATDSAMTAAIQKYQKIVAAGGWQAIPQGPALKRGDVDNRVVLLRRRLLATGDLRDGGGQATKFDGYVEQALKRFQQRVGLTPSGKVNRRTFKALNITAVQRLEQLRLNQIRIRELIQRTAGKRYVLVNIPAYELQAVAVDRVELYSRVIVGKPHTPTPTVDAHIRAVNYLPHWHVPQSIAVRALIPHIKKDPDYLRREHIRVYASWGGAEVDPRDVNWWSQQGERYVFRQDPGEFNALGVVRIDMPNKHIVYMHDTPLKKLFNYHLRPYSAGCVRVQRVVDLANWLLSHDNPQWNPSYGSRVIQGGQPETIKLNTQVPVFFAYVTAWASAFGGVAFREDIYQRDSSGAHVASAGDWETNVKIITP